MKITLGHFVCKKLLTLAWVFGASWMSIAQGTGMCPTPLFQKVLQSSTPFFPGGQQDPFVRDIIFWLNAQKKDTSFLNLATVQAFLERHPHWPHTSAMQKIVEEGLAKTPVASQRIVQFLGRHTPLTPAGHRAYIQALLDLKQLSLAKEVLRKYWRTATLSPQDEKEILARFGTLLTKKDHEERLTHCLWQSQVASLELLMARVSPALRAKAALIRNLLQGCEVSVIPAQVKKSPGAQDEMVLWAYLKWLKGKKDYETLRKIFLTFPRHLKNPQAFYSLRVLAAREWLEAHNPSQALKVLENSGLSSGAACADVEWTAGWVALSFLKNPPKALGHFKKFNEIVRTPVSLSRAGYWLGKTYAALGDKVQSKAFYQQSSRYPTTFYGQLACYALGVSATPQLLSAPQVSEGERRGFERQDIVRALRLLAPLKEAAQQPIARLLCALGALPLTRGERQLTVQLASRVHPYLAVDLSRTLWTKDPTMPLLKIAYPCPPTPPHLTPNERTLVLAICYRESRFNPTILGGAGELGLMQIMPQTAVQLAAEGGYAHTPDKLLNPMYNMTLGALFLKQLTERFPQGLFLATAGYNAGPGAVNKWLKTVGDPNAQVFGTPFHFPASVINWIEAIPFDVTRDYVHRAVESYTVYAHILGEKPQAIQKAVFGKAF